MAPFAVCTNPKCDFVMDLWFDRRNGNSADEPDKDAPCPLCGSNKTDWCPRCYCLINELEPSGAITRCHNCGADLRTTAPPPITHHLAEDLKRRMALAVKCLDELVVLLMERIAAKARITDEELIQACSMENTDEDDQRPTASRKG